jgi:mRNA interferase MazF
MVNNATPTSVKQREIVWLDFDPQSGHEQGGRRPAVVISKTAYNTKSGRAFLCPITSQVKGYPYEIPVDAGRITGVILVDQMKNADWKSRNAQPTGEFITEHQLQQIWLLLDSVR